MRCERRGVDKVQKGLHLFVFCLSAVEGKENLFYHSSVFHWLLNINRESSCI